MHSLSADFASGILAAQKAPCLSLYQPTHRHHPPKQQDPIRFQNLVRLLEEALLKKEPKREAHLLLEPFRALAGDMAFWNHTRDGLAVLGAHGFFRAYVLQRPVTERVVVADSFHTKPLLRILQSADRYQILGLTRDRIRLFEGNRDTLDEIVPASGVPRTLTDALGSEHTEPQHGIYTYGTGARGPAMHHGHGSRKDDLDLDAERFFRAVDRAVYDHHSRASGLPLLLAALPEYHKQFRNVSQNPLLMPVGLEVSPESLSLEELRTRAWQAVLPRYVERLDAIVERYGAANARGKGTGELAAAALAAVEGRIRILLVDADQVVPGHLDPMGKVRLAGPNEVGVDDLLDDIAELVTQKGGEIVVVPRERMPTETGLAAIYAY